MASSSNFNSEEARKDNQKLDLLLDLLKNKSTTIIENDDSTYELSDEEDPEYLNEEKHESGNPEELIKYDTEVPSSFLISKYESSQLDKADSTDQTNIYMNLCDLTPHISYEEFSLIHECQDSKLQKLLTVNRGQKVQLTNLLNKYLGLLQECKKSITLCQIRNNSRRKVLRSLRNTNKIGYPYFNVAGFGPPNNPDHKRKLDNQENTNYLDKPILWNESQLMDLMSKVRITHFLNVLSELEDDKKDFIQKCGRVDSKEQQKMIAKKADEIFEWKTLYPNIPLPDLSEVDTFDWHIIADELFKDKNMAIPCKAIWRLYLHPSINKSDFTEAEEDRLVDLAISHNYQDWHLIAEELDTNRSEYLVCKHFFTNMVSDSGPAFTFEEDEKLCEFVESQQGPIMWSTILKNFSGRSARRLFSRYKYYSEIRDKKKGKFSAEEDKALAFYVKKYGEDFDQVANHFRYRSKHQLKNRYEGYLKVQGLKLSSYTLEEDQMILDHVKQFGSRHWAKLAEKTQRNPAHLRHRYGTLLKHLKDDPTKSLESIPRRGTRKDYVESLDRFKALNELDFDNMDDVNSENEPKSLGRKSLMEIDKELVKFFVPTAQIKKAKALRSIGKEQLDRCAQSVRFILNMLNANLYIPKVFDRTCYLGLDDLDVQILTRIQEKCIESEATIKFKAEKCEFRMPPNISTLNSFHWLLVSAIKEKNRNVLHRFRNWQGNKMLDSFRERFDTLFRWPSLMSTLEPKVPTFQSINASEKPQEPKKRGRPIKNKSKITKMNEARRKNSDNPVAKLIIQFKSNAEVLKPAVTADSNNEIIEIIDDKVSKSVEDVKKMIQENGSEQTASKVLIKVDKSTIEKLKKENILKGPPLPMPLKIIPNKGTECTDKSIGNNGLQANSTNHKSSMEKTGNVKLNVVKTNQIYIDLSEEKDPDKAPKMSSGQNTTAVNNLNQKKKSKAIRVLQNVKYDPPTLEMSTKIDENITENQKDSTADIATSTDNSNSRRKRNSNQQSSASSSSKRRITKETTTVTTRKRSKK